MVVITEGTRDLTAAPDAAARADLRDQADKMLTRLAAIQRQMGSSPTTAQVVAAVNDLAAGQVRLVQVVAALIRHQP